MHTKLTQGDRFGQLFSTVTHYYQAWAKQQGINYNQLAVLHSLVRYQHCTQKQICEEWVLPKQTISTICKQYIDEGLIVFISNDDKREKLLSLTEQGKAFATPIIERLDQLEQRIFTEFGLERSEKLLQELSDMEQVFRKYANDERIVSNHHK